MQSALESYTSDITPPTSPDAALELLRQPVGTYILYMAGLPKYTANFTRDSLLSGIISADSTMLKDQLEVCALYQGRIRSAFTGEEPGKIYHERPDTLIRDRSTAFNACDTTALFLLAHEVYMLSTGDYSLLEKHKKAIEKAAHYILSHLQNDFFIEDPLFCGAERFALKVTYWKDSHLIGRENFEPSYPIIYTLAHVQNMRGLKSASVLLQDSTLKKRAESMCKKIMSLYDDELHTFVIARDQKGLIKGISSDTLHLLFYLEPYDLPEYVISEIVPAVASLETQLGYRTLSPELTYQDNLHAVHEGYHTRTVWPFEQALIHIAARKFHLSRVCEVAERISPHLDTFPELFVIEGSGIRKGGMHTQLWTVAAQKYFASLSREKNLWYV